LSVEVNTDIEFTRVIASCRDIFLKKHQDYGSAWRILRLPSLTDQIYIKAKRIRKIQESGHQKVEENVYGEFQAIVNYCIMAMIQIELKDSKNLKLEAQELSILYDQSVQKTVELQQNKNHDYDEAWKEMRVSSMTDIILMKILRIKQIEDNFGQTLISEGVESNYQDVMNYSIYCLILLHY